MNTEINKPWTALAHRGRCEMFVMTARYIQEQFRAFMPGPYAAEIKNDEGGATVLNFLSENSMTEFVFEMVPTLLEIHYGEGEDIDALVVRLQAAYDVARSPAAKAAEAAIVKAAAGHYN